MSIFLDTRGKRSLAIAICGRCGIKYPHDQLRSDPNSPGLMCCPDGCLDRFDPYRLSPRPADRIALNWARPDVSLGVVPTAIPINQPQLYLTDGNGVPIIGNDGQKIAASPPMTQILPTQPWAPNQATTVGSSVTNGNAVGLAAAGLIFYQFASMTGGRTGPTPPAWNNAIGSETFDNEVIWLNMGIYLSP